MGLHGRQDETIDRRLGPVTSARVWNRRHLGGNKRPEAASLVKVDRFLGRGRCTDARVDGTAIDPLDQIGDRALGQFPTGWHLIRFVADGLDDQTLIDLARNQRGARIATLQKPLGTIQGQPTLESFRLRGVAFVAMLDENRSDFRLKEFQLGG